jgi:PASTA domain
LAVQPVARKVVAPLALKAAPQPAAQRQDPEIVAVPDITGTSVAEAEVALAEIGLIVRIASYARSEEEPEGVIIHQDAPAGYETYPGATVTVTVSSGPPPVPEEPEEVEPVEPPDVELPEVEPVEPVGEKAASKDVPPRDLEAERKPAREKASPTESGRDRAKDDRVGAKEERRRPGQRPATEKRPRQEEERHGSLGEAKHGGKGDEGKEKRSDREDRRSR